MRSLFFVGLALTLATVPAAAQTRIIEGGLVPHVAASTIFPEQVGQFRRTSVVAYGPDQRDMSAGYNLVTPNGRLTVTVYIYPPREDASAAQRAAVCRREFDANVREIGSVPTYKDLRRDPPAQPPAVAGMIPDLSHGASFRFRATFDQPDQALQSVYRLYCFVGGNWLVKYRATAGEGFPLGQELEQFIRTGPWPGRRLPGNTVARPPIKDAG
jgi:hypothetical protein